MPELVAGPESAAPRLTHTLAVTPCLISVDSLPEILRGPHPRGLENGAVCVCRSCWLRVQEVPALATTDEGPLVSSSSAR